MRKVVVYEMVSLDGVAESPDQFFTDWDGDMDANLERIIAGQDTVVLGRRSYDEWAAYWPTSDIEPFATFINAVEKFVATSTPLEQEWAATTRIDGDLTAFVRDLKNGPGGDIGVHASISTAQSLLAGGVVDEIQLVVAPHVVGSGRGPFDGVSGTGLELVHSTATPSGHLLLAYRVAG